MEVVFEKGSLSELITGKKIKNKEKVVVRYGKVNSEISPPGDLPKTNKSDEKDDDAKNVKSNAGKKKLKKKKSVIESESTIVTDCKGDESVNVKKGEEDSSKNEFPISREGKRGNRQEKKEKAKMFKELQEKKDELQNNPEELARTIFVGNVPLSTKKIQFKKFFSKYGKVESVRFRCPPIKNINTSKKVAVIKGEYHPERDSWTSYIKFETEDDAKKALEANGQIFKDHHLRVSFSKPDEKRNEDKAIFLGNLPLNVEDDILWKTFECCGEIDSVRIIRDSATGMGKGFAFVNFVSSDSVQLALEMEDVKINKNIIRIQPCNSKAARKNKNSNSAKVIKPKKPKKLGVGNKRKRKEDNDEMIENKSKKLKSNDLQNNGTNQKTNINNNTHEYNSFSGTKVDLKKKKKKNKGIQKKLQLAKKLMS